MTKFATRGPASLRRLTPSRIYRALRTRLVAQKRLKALKKKHRELRSQLQSEYREKLQTKGGFRFACLYAHYYENEPIKKDHVLYESYHGTVFGCNPYAIFLYLFDNPRYAHLHHVIAIADLGHPTVARFGKHPRVTLVEVDSEEYIRYCESCEYLVNNTSFRPHFIKREEQTYIYTWHATLLKKLAAPWDSTSVAKSLMACDYFVSPNKYTTERLIAAYQVETNLLGQVTEIGYPRNDLLFSSDVADVRSRLGARDGQKIVVYAPTWRGTLGGPRNMLSEMLRFTEEVQARVGDDFLVVAKPHNMAYRFLNEENEHRVVPLSLDTNELLAATDLLISDYSGIMFDFMVTRRPIVAYVHDREEYVREQGEFSVPLEELPVTICETFDEVVDAIGENPQSRVSATEYEERSAPFISAEDGRARERLVELVFGGEIGESGRVYRLSRSPKKRMLMYPGSMAGNGVTESFLALVAELDHNRYDVSVLLPGSRTNRERFSDIGNVAHQYFMNATWGFTEEEYIQVELFRRFGLDARSDTRILSQFATRNTRRVFDGLSFDCVVNYSGYHPVWAMVLALGPQASRRVIYLHNDLEKDRTTKNPDLHATFSTYRLYDSRYAVSKECMSANRSGTAPYIREQFGFDVSKRIGYLMNIVDADKIKRLADQFSTTQFEGQEYFVLRRSDSARSIQLVEKPHPDCVSFVTVGRLSPEKRQDRLLKAFSRVAAVHPNVRLYVVGEGARKSYLVSLAEKLGVEDEVVFVGYVDNPFPIIALSDCFILPSDYEGLGLVVLEALILGKPVISTNIPGPRGILKPNHGVLVRRSVAALENAMLQFVEEGMEREPYDYASHNRAALELFYEKVCKDSIPDGLRP